MPPSKPRPGESLADLRPDIAAQIADDVDGAIARSLRLRSSHRVTWDCPIGHRWVAKVSDRTLGRGCGVCAGKIVLPGFNDLASQRPEVAAEFADDLNEGVTASDVTWSSGRKVWWRCGLGHIFNISVNARTAGGNGCRYCTGQAVWPGFNDLATLRPDLAAELADDLNEGVTALDLVLASGRELHWRCALGHTWTARVSNRTTHKSGCRYCAGQAVWPGFNDLATLRPDLAAELADDLNEGVTALDLTLTSNRAAWWRCAQGHTWRAVVANRSRGTGCPNCSVGMVSQIESALVEALGEGVTANTSLPVRWSSRRSTSRVDALVDLGAAQLVVEYDGAWFHRDREADDTAKTVALLDAGYLVARVRDNGLAHLAIEHPNLKQVDYRYDKGSHKEKVASLRPVAAGILAWARRRA